VDEYTQECHEQLAERALPAAYLRSDNGSEFIATIVPW